MLTEAVAILKEMGLYNYIVATVVALTVIAIFNRFIAHS